MLSDAFFARDPLLVAKDLLGKVIRHYHAGLWLSAIIIETEAYYLEDKASHASLGFTKKRRALFMQAGTIYMYYARGGDSLNISCYGEGNAVLIKSGFPFRESSNPAMIAHMLKLNPIKNSETPRQIEKLCSGQTLLCRSLGLKVPEWDQKSFDPNRFFIEDAGYRPQKIIQTQRLGIPIGRDHELPYRFIDSNYARFCTRNPLTRKKKEDSPSHYVIHEYQHA